MRRLAAAVAAFVLIQHPTAPAQQPAAPLPLLPEAPSRSFNAEPLPPPAADAPASPAAPTPAAEGSPATAAGAGPPPAAEPGMTRFFCEQPVPVRLTEVASVPERYRGLIGIWSDAAWTPRLCAALIVENVASDGTATITYAFGPMGSNTREPGGVLSGTGVVRDGELRFQNSDGSQFAFRPLYSDLEGRLTTPQGQTYEAIFKKTR